MKNLNLPLSARPLSAIPLAALLGVLCGGSLSADPKLTLAPMGGAVSGVPGSVVGWGFTLVNDTNFSLFLDGPSAFCQQGQDPELTTCTQPGGSVYTDYMFGTVVPPNSTLTQLFDPAMKTGVGQFQIDADEMPSSMDAGSIVLIFSEWNGDPLNGGAQVSGDLEVSAAARVTKRTPRLRQPPE